MNDLKSKEVININDGRRLGFVNDVVLNLANGRLISITVPGGYKFLGVFGKANDCIIPWENIKKIGDDIILIDSLIEE